MLFIAQKSAGIGSELSDLAIEVGARLVDVNKENERAVRFYKAKDSASSPGRKNTATANHPIPRLLLNK